MALWFAGRTGRPRSRRKGSGDQGEHPHRSRFDPCRMSCEEMGAWQRYKGTKAKPSVSQPGGFAVCTQNDKATTATTISVDDRSAEAPKPPLRYHLCRWTIREIVVCA
jgi:hypothetical protein